MCRRAETYPLYSCPIFQKASMNRGRGHFCSVERFWAWKAADHTANGLLFLTALFLSCGVSECLSLARRRPPATSALMSLLGVERTRHTHRKYYGS